jgi:HK97 family phage prohead protease
MAEFETRTVSAQIELREENEAPTLIGHAATFNDPYDVGWFRESIHPEAFSRTLKNNADVRLLIDHEGQPLARTKSGTLILGTDSKGLTVEARLDPTDPDVQRLIPKMRRGDMDQMSFAFRVPAGGDTMDHVSDPPHRTIREANLNGGDVSIVTYPANANADAQIRARDERDSALVLIRSMLTEIEDGARFDERCQKRFVDALDFLGVDLHARTVPEPTEPVAGPAGLPLDLARRLADEARRNAA